MPKKKEQKHEVTISDLAFGGAGIAHINGMAVFVEGGIPGDRVWVQLVRKKKRHAHARVIDIVEPSPFRIDPRCPYHGYCGGCRWQFLEYDRQLEYKRSQVEQCLDHIAGMKDVFVHPAIPSSRIYGYRNKMEFTCSDRRWLLPHELGKEGIDRDFALGLHVPGTFHKVLDIENCLLQPETGNRILKEIRSFIRDSKFLPYGLKSHTGFWRFVVIRHSVAGDEWMVNVVTAREENDEMKRLADRLLPRFETIGSVVNNVTDRKSGVAFGDYEVPVAGESAITETIGGYDFRISANSFFQTNSRQAVRLVETIRKYADLSGNETVVDLYCGAGTISINLSSYARAVVGVESVESAVEDARTNCLANKVSNCRFLSGDVGEVLPGIKDDFDVLVVDPPRAGMHKNVVRHILAGKADRMVYVSCNPSTMARDLHMLQEEYRIMEVQPVDMFPHTYHIECVVRLERQNRR
jgi:23S rRNA (uracil1939-C5)-methyltransferase